MIINNNGVLNDSDYDKTSRYGSYNELSKKAGSIAMYKEDRRKQLLDAAEGLSAKEFAALFLAIEGKREARINQAKNQKDRN